MGSPPPSFSPLRNSYEIFQKSRIDVIENLFKRSKITNRDLWVTSRWQVDQAVKFGSLFPGISELVGNGS